jgi:hypothetical protein
MDPYVFFSLSVPEKGLLPKPVTPFLAESPAASGARNTPRALGAPAPSVPRRPPPRSGPEHEIVSSGVSNERRPPDA